MRSSSLPGVAISISTPLRSTFTCGAWPTPPNMTVCLSPVYFPYAAKFSPICIASSLVGVSTSALIRSLSSPPFGKLYKVCRTGMAKEAVLPVPVCAHPKRSFPLSTTGMDCD